MLKNTILAAATLAISMVAFQPAAQAHDLHVGVHFNHGPWIGGHWGGGHWGGGHWNNHWPGPSKLTCHQGKRKLRRNGYHRIVQKDCHGKFYRYRVVRNGKIFRIRMNAFTGRYNRTFLGYV